MGLSVELPPEPPDRAVVLDRNAGAWQRRDLNRATGRWVPAGVGCDDTESWSHLVVDRGPLTRLVTEDEAVEYAGGEPVEDRFPDGWQRAGYEGPGCRRFEDGTARERGHALETWIDGWADAGFDAPDCELFAGNDDPAPCAMTAP